MLSKTRFMHGCQCPLRLWNECHHPERASSLDASRMAVIEQGNRVGELARDRYPGGLLVEADHTRQRAALKDTSAMLKMPGLSGIFEAAFVHSEVLVRADVLERDPEGGWNLIEVKCASYCHAEHETDLALQAWVLRGAGLSIRKAGVLTLNTEYAYDGKALNLDALFRFHDRTALAASAAAEIEATVQGQIQMLARGQAPGIAPGHQCFEPYPCPFHDYCTQGLPTPEHPLSDLPRLRGAKARELEAQGIRSIQAIPADSGLSPLQERVRECVVSSQPWVSKDLPAALEAFTYPIHYLDFETYYPAIPPYAGMHPFERLPFQWSCHHEDRAGGVHHSEFLPVDAADPREAFARSMLATLGTQGAICVYSGFEAGVIRQLASQLPELAEPLFALTGRLVDMLQIIREHYYHPDFHGSYSIKRVLPVLVPGMDYACLAIRQGEMASLGFQELLASEDPLLRARLRRDLLEYCSMDTLAMLKLRHSLSRIAKP